MRLTRGLILGFAVGTLIGLLIYLRLQRDKKTPKRANLYLRLEVDPEKPGRPEPADAPVLSVPPQPPKKGMDADPLEVIKGIGPVYAQRLRAAGINTFTELGKLTPENLQAIIGSRLAEDQFASWIAEANQLAKTSS